jgi:hypothetical protein
MEMGTVKKAKILRGVFFEMGIKKALQSHLQGFFNKNTEGSLFFKFA